MTHTAIGIFQGDADWNVPDRVDGFATRAAAEIYANSFRIRLMDGRLYRDHADGCAPDDKPWIEVLEADVSLTRLKSVARQRIAHAHQVYQAQGLENAAVALESIKEFEKTGTNLLVMSDDDYEPIALPISQWHQETGLTCGFGSLAYAVESGNPAQK